jgi:hypothetical protein
MLQLRLQIRKNVGILDLRTTTEGK